MRKKYETEAKNLSKAIDIAIGTFNKYYKKKFALTTAMHKAIL